MRLVDQPGQGEWRAVWTLRPVRASTLKSRCWSTCDDDLGICLFSNPAAARFVRIVRRRCHCHCHVVPALSRDSRCEEISISHAFRSLARSLAQSVGSSALRPTDENLFRLHKFCERSLAAASLAPFKEAITHANGDLTLGDPTEGGISVSGRARAVSCRPRSRLRSSENPFVLQSRRPATNSHLSRDLPHISWRCKWGF